MLRLLVPAESRLQPIFRSWRHLAVYQEVVLNEEDGVKSPCAMNLHNAVLVSQQRTGKRAAQLSPARMNYDEWHKNKL